MFALMLLMLAGPDVVVTGPKPIGDPSRWISNDDYPIDAIRAGKEGAVVMDVVVDDKGRAARCRVMESSGTDILDKTACAALSQRGSWGPTLDEAGKPIFATYRRRVKWVLPAGLLARKREPLVLPPDIEVEVAKLPVPVSQALVVVRQIQRADGTAESCVIATPSPSPILNRAACRVAAPLTALDPIGNAAGERVRGVRWRTIQFVEKPAGAVAK